MDDPGATRRWPAEQALAPLSVSLGALGIAIFLLLVSLPSGGGFIAIGMCVTVPLSYRTIRTILTGGAYGRAGRWALFCSAGPAAAACGSLIVWAAMGGRDFDPSGYVALTLALLLLVSGIILPPLAAAAFRPGLPIVSRRVSDMAVLTLAGWNLNAMVGVVSLVPIVFLGS
jgi:hypothetical protein